jgi:hypothetical protein
MEVDLNNTFAYDKIMLHIDSNNGTFIKPDEFSFYIKFSDTIKNAISIQIINITVITNTQYTTDDKFYLSLNNFDREISYIKQPDNNINEIKYFALIPYDGTIVDTNKYKSTLAISTNIGNFASSFNHTINPVLQSLNRFDLSLRDKNNNIYRKSDIHSIKLNICIYTVKKNLS